MTDHAHHQPMPVGSKLKFGIMFTSAILVLEVVGGLLSNSLWRCSAMPATYSPI